MDKSAAFSAGSDRTDDMSIPSQTSAMVPSLTSSKQDKGNDNEKSSEAKNNQQDMDLMPNPESKDKELRSDRERSQLEE